MKTKLLLIVVIAMGTSISLNAMPVLDPTNLVQNIIQVAQQQITSRFTGDVKEVAKTQLKADNQTVADVIGMNSTTKTSFNLDLAEFNYKNNPSTLIKNYYEKDLKVRDRISAVGTHFNSVKSFYANTVMQLLNKVDNEVVTRELTDISKIYGLYGKKYDPFTNTSGKSSANINIGNLLEKFENTGEGTAFDPKSINTKALDSLYAVSSDSINAKRKDLEYFMQSLENIKGPEKIVTEVKFEATVDYLIKNGYGELAKQYVQDVQKYGTSAVSGSSVISSVNDYLGSQLSSITSSLQDNLQGLLSSTMGGIGLGGLFGSSADEKGKGQEIKIDAKMGVLSDIDRIKLINEAVDNYTQLDNRITAVHKKLLDVKALHDDNKFLEQNSFDMNRFLKRSGAFDYKKTRGNDEINTGVDPR